MCGLERVAPAVRTALAIAAVLTVSSAANPPAANARIPGEANPCSLPGVDHVCDVPGDLIGGAASAAGDVILHGVTAWVTNAAVWATTQVGGLINATASPDVQAPWFREQYGSMLRVAAMLAVPMLLLAVIQAVIRQDAWLLARSALGYLPLAVVLAAGAVMTTQLLVAITDDLSRSLVKGLGGQSTNLLESVGDAFSHAISDQNNDGLPLFGIFLGALVLMVGSLVLWIELVIRDATIYIGLFFLPLTFVAMIWPATSRYARRLVEFVIAVVLAKLVIVAIIGLAAAALTNAGVGDRATSPGTEASVQDGQRFERMVAGGALLLLAAYSPFALLRAIPLMEGAMASVGQSKRQVGAAVGAGTGGAQSAAAHFRNAMSRQPESFPASMDVVGTTSGAGWSAARSWLSGAADSDRDPRFEGAVHGSAGTGPPAEPAAATGAGATATTERGPETSAHSASQPLRVEPSRGRPESSPLGPSTGPPTSERSPRPPENPGSSDRRRGS